MRCSRATKGCSRGRRRLRSARPCRSAAWACRTTSPAPRCSSPATSRATSPGRRSMSTAATCCREVQNPIMSSHPHHARTVPRQRHPELEHDYSRSPSLGYEAPEDAGLVRCLAHGFPTPLARWHFHDEYELHLITCTSGKAFIGDWIGPFQPGHLVLCGPRLPHNWVSYDVPETGVVERDLVIQFRHDPVAHAAEQIPELADVMALLERAKHGVEFFRLSEQAHNHWHAVKL